MKSGRFALGMCLLLVALSVVGAGVVSQSVGAQGSQDGQEIGEVASLKRVVEQLNSEQQAAIDNGLAAKLEPRVRPETYTEGSKHCVRHFEPVSPDVKEPVTQDKGCYSNFADALAAATGGRVLLPKEFRPDDITQEILDTGLADAKLAGIQTYVVIGIDWEHANFQGSSIINETDHSAGCTDGTSYGWENMGGNWWNDRISSAQGYTGCRADHYEAAYYGGALLRCYPNSTSVCANSGVMNDQTSSINWRR